MIGYMNLASSYDDHTVAPLLYYKYSPKIDKILFSNEYHTNNEFFESYVCIGDVCNDSLIFTAENIKCKLKTNDYAPIYLKREIKEIGEIVYNLKSLSLSHIPNIVILGIGHYSQQTNIEIRLNKMMHEDRIKVYQFFSNHLWISKHNEKPFNDLLKDENDIANPEVGIIGIEINDQEQLLSDELYDVVKLLSPDYLILCMENMNIDYSKIDTICKIRFKKIPDAIVLSDFFGFYSNEINLPIYEVPINNIRIREEFVNLRGDLLYQELHTNIINTITSVKKIAKII